MVGQTIAERLCRTKSPQARHILQDEAAIFGAQGVVNEELEAELTRVEVSNLDTMIAERNAVVDPLCVPPACPEIEFHPMREAHRSAKRAESNSPQAEWLRGVAVV
jgi:hypothetical protein